MVGKIRYLVNGLAAVGLLSILAVGTYLAVDSFFSGWGVKTVFKTATSSDSKAKAAVYQVNVGAAGATRTYVALSNPQVDGSRKGDVVLTLVDLQENARQIDVVWQANRLLVITYPVGDRIEFAVSKTRGITIELAAH